MSDIEYLSIGEVAAHFGWTTRVVERLALGGKLPGVEVNGQWRFRREELIDWLDQKIQTLDADRVAELEHQLESELEHEGVLAHGGHHPLASRLAPEGIALGLRADSKQAVLRELTGLAEQTGKVLDRGYLFASLAEREELCSTALPGGVAVCHPRRPAPFAIRESLLCFARTERPVPFGAEDGEPTQLFFLLCTPDDRSHLHSLARLIRVLDRPTLELLRRVATPADAIALISSRELTVDSVADRAAAVKP